MPEPTSALTFGDLVLEAAHAAGVAYYGADGSEAPQVPTDAHDLAEMQRLVNHAIHAFIADAPPTGWRWLTVTRAIDLVAGTGDYPLPDDFSGVVAGPIHFAADSDNFSAIRWTSEATIRRYRQDGTASSTTPHSAAIRRIESTPRKWELLVYPSPGEAETVEFPYEIYFDRLTTLTDYLPVPFRHDETLRAAVKAQVEADIDDLSGGPRKQRYQELLQQSYLIDAKSAPRRLGYNANPVHPRTLADLRDWRSHTDRPNVDISAF
ncbi:MAG: hypothetical protein AAGG38_02175 [Planctomycetota bacterium]